MGKMTSYLVPILLGNSSVAATISLGQDMVTLTLTVIGSWKGLNEMIVAFEK